MAWITSLPVVGEVQGDHLQQPPRPVRPEGQEITLVLGLVVGACGFVGLRNQHGKAAKIAGAIGLVVVAAVIGCYDVATISYAAGDVPELYLELHASVGTGLWLTVAAAMGGLGGLILTWAR